MPGNRVYLLSAIALAVSCSASKAAGPSVQFYTEGTTIGGWLRVPEKGYDMTWHFVKLNPDQAGWSQELAVKYYDRKGIYYYDLRREGEFKGFYDPAGGEYFRLPPQFRRHRVEQIRPDWFQKL